MPSILYPPAPVHPDEEDMRECRHCHVFQPLKAFYTSTKNRWACRACIQSGQATKHSRAHRQAYDAKRNYGITPGEYVALHTRQGGVCAVCGEPETSTRKGIGARLSIDHDHSTGQVRALLCHACNTALGLLRESPTRIAQLLTYVESHQT